MDSDNAVAQFTDHLYGGASAPDGRTLGGVHHEDEALPTWVHRRNLNDPPNYYDPQNYYLEQLPEDFVQRAHGLGGADLVSQIQTPPQLLMAIPNAALGRFAESRLERAVELLTDPQARVLAETTRQTVHAQR